MEILPLTNKKVPGVVIPEKVKLELFVQAYSFFNQSISYLDPDNFGDPIIEKWSQIGDAKYSAICWILWELGLYEEFSYSIEKDIREKYEALTV